MMKLTKILLAVILPIIISCHAEWQNPNDTVPAEELEITSLLATPHVYDSAGVRLKGMVWDSEIVRPEPKITEEGEVIEKQPYLHFKLSDQKGYYIDVVADESQQLQDGDIVEVVGYFRRFYNVEKSDFINEIHAKKITVVESLTEKYEKSAVK